VHIVNRTNKYGTFIVLTHVLINIIHGAAHRELHVGLHSAGMLFVVSVVVLCPLLALALLWTCQKRLGLILLTFSMAASATFGLYNHFVVSGPDHVSGQPPGPWSTVFVVTAYLLFLIEAIGTYAGFYFLRGRASRVLE